MDDTRCCVECEMRLMVRINQARKEVGTLSLLTGYHTGPNANKQTDECYDDVRDSEWDGVRHRSGVHASFP